MMLFHLDCPAAWPWWQRALPRRWRPHNPRPFHRLRLKPQNESDLALTVRGYKCEGCGARFHADMDWAEGATVEPNATLA